MYADQPISKVVERSDMYQFISCILIRTKPKLAWLTLICDTLGVNPYPRLLISRMSRKVPDDSANGNDTFGPCRQMFQPSHFGLSKWLVWPTSPKSYFNNILSMYACIIYIYIQFIFIILICQIIMNFF